MNIAFPALIVFILLLPGFIARSRIKLAERLSLDYSPFGQVVTEGVMWAAVLHLTWLSLSRLVAGHALRAERIFMLLAADPSVQSRALEGLAAEAGSVALYFGTLFAFAYVGPALVRRVIQRLRLDRAGAPLSGLLRFSGAPWYYLLSGADFSADDIPDCISISAIVNVAGKPFLYTGLLDAYFLDQDGKLDRVVLQLAMRRPLAADKSAGEGRRLDRFYPIDGDYFVLRYSEAITLNVEYIKLPDLALR
jgi:hypothetical protein